MTRPDWIETWLRVADVMADRSTCQKLHVGACLVNEKNHVVASGFNGAPRKQPHCDNCIRIRRNIPSGEQYELCESIHAEMNCLLQAGQNAWGTKLFMVCKSPDSSVYYERYPCFMCSKFLYQNGVTEAYVALSPLKQNVEVEYGVGLIESIYLCNRDEKGLNKPLVVIKKTGGEI